MFVFVRAVTYAALFIGLLLIYLPARLLSWSGIVRSTAIGVPQVAGMIIGAAGAAVALWCVFTFAVIGKGTPAPFDPPRRLVIQGYAGLFLLASHVFVVVYEEPALHRTFGQEYEAYCRRVRRWWPRIGTARDGN
jgi:hypothetical protein